MVRTIVLALLLLCSVKSFSAFRVSGFQAKNPDNYVHQASIYAVRSMRNAQWAYLGFAPRMEDPTRVKVVFSKATYTMRVTMQLTKQEIADYPRYLSVKAKRTAEIIEAENIVFYQNWRWLHFMTEVLAIEEQLGINSESPQVYSEQAYQNGLAILQEKFPSNIFPLPGADDVGAGDIAVIGHFIYPITIHKSGKDPKARKDFTILEGFGGYDLRNGATIEDNLANRVQERRSFHRAFCKRDLDGDGVKETTVRCDNDVFGGFPAMWIDDDGVGIGVHGPIRFTRESNGLSGNRSKWNERLSWTAKMPSHVAQAVKARCETYPKTMREFWVRTDQDILGNFLTELEEKFGQPMTRLTGLEKTSLQWRLIRNNNSKGCFRAEPLELRHLLPTDRKKIHDTLLWTVTDELDKIPYYDYNTNQWTEKYVDVNYYTWNHYNCDMTREEWIEYKILSNSKVAGEGKIESVEQFVNNSIQFDYNPPHAAEFYGQVPVSEGAENMRAVRGRSDQYMKQLNRASLEMGEPTSVEEDI